MSNLVLYRKYRPKTFAQVVNQDHIKTTLSNAVLNDRVGHAYLFIGPRGTGKTTLARIFARAINCPNRKGAEPCNECAVCKSFLEANSLDLLEIDAASHTGVDNIRELIDHLQFAPAQARYKVIIIDEVHMLSKGAFNALLKTLEEPPKHAVFIMATTEVHKVPATIISRTQRFDFKKVGVADLAKLLEFVANDNQVKVTPGALTELAAAADGSFRDGLSLLDQVINYASGEINEELVEEVLGLTGSRTLSQFMDLLIERDAAQAVNFISEILYAGRDLYQFQKDFLEYLRKLLLIKIGAIQDLALAPEILKKLQTQAGLLEARMLTRIIEIFQKAENDMKWATIQSLPLELATVEAIGQPETKKEPSERPPISSGGEVSSTTEPIQDTDDSDGSDEERLNQVKSHWHQVLDKMKDYNHSLVSSLKLAELVAVRGGELWALFPYKFHKDAIDARKNRIVIDQVIEDVTTLKLQIKPMLQKDWTGTKASSEPNDQSVVASALQILGGEVEN